MRKFVRKFGWGYFAVLKGAKVVLTVPLGVIGAIAVLMSLNYSLFSWFLMVLLALYVAAEFFGSLGDFSAHWDAKSQQGNLTKEG